MKADPAPCPDCQLYRADGANSVANKHMHWLHERTRELEALIAEADRRTGEKFPDWKLEAELACAYQQLDEEREGREEERIRAGNAEVLVAELEARLHDWICLSNWHKLGDACYEYVTENPPEREERG